MAVLKEGLRHFPRDLDLVQRAAELCLQARLLESAGSWIEYGLSQAGDGPMRERFTRLKTRLSTSGGAVAPE